MMHQPNFVASLINNTPPPGGHQSLLRVLDSLGNPHHRVPLIHVAGTNGKGSTSAMIASCLAQGGFKVGLSTGPHLLSINERICINGTPLPIERLEAISIPLQEVLHETGVHLSFLETLTALALLAFVAEEVDIAVIEVGAGGTLDPTNVITPILSVITPISYDHMQLLGDTLAAIASHKAGIIKPGVPVITAPQDPEAMTVIHHTARTLGSTLTVTTEASTLLKEESTLTHNTLESTGLVSGLYHCPLLGKHQLANALTALTAVQSLPAPFTISVQDSQEGLARTRWPGRLEVLQTTPLIIADGAHNASGFAALRSFLLETNLRPHILIGCKRGKDLSTYIELIAPLAQSHTITQGSFLPEDPLHIQRTLAEAGYTATIQATVPTALTYMQTTYPEGPILITGSLYLLGDIYKALQAKP